MCPGQAGVMDAVCWLMLALFPPHLTNKTISQQAPARPSPSQLASLHNQSSPVTTITSILAPLNSDIYKCSKIYQFSQLLLYKLLYTCPARGSYSRNGPRNSVKLRMKWSAGKNEITLK